MWLNYLKIAYRNITRQKFYSLLNIAGLAISITCCILIGLYIKEEASYDKFQVDGEQIYRLCNRNNMGGKIDTYCNAPRPITPQMKEIYPEIEAVTRVVGINGLYTHTANLSYEQNMIESKKIFAVDSTFFNVFATEFIAGTPKDALTGEIGIVISESLAGKLFGEEEAFGKTLFVGERFPITVKGVFKDQPGRSHFEYEALLPWAAAYRPGEETAWYGWQVYQYLKLHKGTDATALQAKFPQFFTDYMKERYDTLDGTSHLFLQKMQDIHLKSDLTWEMVPNGSLNNLYILASIGLFLLIIACINYVNLATARSVRRAREVGLRKLFGSQRGLLIRQFLVESIIISLIASLFALVIAELLLPVFNSITMRDISLNLFSNQGLILVIIGVGIFVGILAGIYPALVMSNFTIVAAIKSRSDNGTGGMLLRKILIVMQFAISIALIIATLILIEQIKFARDIDLGFNKENVLAVTVRDTLVTRNLTVIKQELRDHPDIISAACSYDLPGTTFNRFPATVENNEGGFIQTSCQFMQVDYDFVSTMDMSITDGRNYQRDQEENGFGVIMVNETAVEKFGWDNPIGKRVRSHTDSAGVIFYQEVIGVVKDFHPNSVRQEISPIIIYLINDQLQSRTRGNLSLFIRIKGENLHQTMGDIKGIIQQYNPDDPFQYVFLDEHLNRMYEGEDRLIKLFSYFTGMIIFIACLGLFGLASFTAEKRRREIGIRKVLGATISQIVLLLSTEFSRWVLLANLIAWPLAWYFMSRWLENFAYRIQINPMNFLGAALAALVIALITVSFQAFRAATSNPVKSMRYE
ncbi:MAG: ABC transporter permease [Candidatus Cloacimonetes bacterium]|nr:ABC transporter permease [Candidatus Cloacimonadota bacterium]